MRKTIRAFLETNHIDAITVQEPFTATKDHPSGTRFKTVLVHEGKRTTLITYGAQIPDENEWDSAVQLWKIHDDIQRYEETFERFLEENEDYLHWFGRGGAKKMWMEYGSYWKRLHHVLGEALFQQFYWLPSESD